jgi:hypothetical protein
MTDKTSHHFHKNHSRKWERLLAVVALCIIAGAWILGKNRTERDLLPLIKGTLPEAGYFEPLPGGSYTAWDGENRTQLMGYVATGAAQGYGGELRTAVALDTQGIIIGLTVIDHGETPPFFHRVLRRGFTENIRGKKYNDTFTLGQDVEGVTGATYTCRAISESVRRTSRKIASRNLGADIPPEPTPPIRFGIPEISLIALFILGFFGRLPRFKYKKTARWVSMLTGLVVLGFIFNKPLTLTIINNFLLGFFPYWRLDLYWIILLLGIFFVVTADNKNPYCEWFCPFGAAQECLGIIGGAQFKISERFRPFFRWFQRALALTAVSVALIYRNPSISSYEVFGAFFRLIGADYQFALLGVVLVAALFIRRPWCGYLCPLRPVTDFLRHMRSWIIEASKTYIKK